MTLKETVEKKKKLRVKRKGDLATLAIMSSIMWKSDLSVLIIYTVKDQLLTLVAVLIFPS